MTERGQYMREIDAAIAYSGYRKYEIAEKLGVHEAAFSRHLRRNMSLEMKTKVLEAIETLKHEREGVGQ